MDGKTRVCGIIANPVEHSMSPLLQNLYAQHTGTNIVYVPFKVEESRLQEAVEGAYALNVLGLNVTVPHKQAVMQYLKKTDPAAEAVGAVNTLVRMDGGYCGYNTDVPGLLRAVREEGISINGRHCIVLGAGGAAKAAVYMLASEGAERIYILNRTGEKAAVLAEWADRIRGEKIAEAMTYGDFRKIPGDGYLAIQCTSVGMYPNVDEAPVEDPEFYEKIEEAFDCVYTPSETKFMRLAARAGKKAFNGLNMLLYQGIISFELWNPGVKVPDGAVTEARLAIRRLLGRKEEKCGADNVILIGFMGAGKTTVGRALAQETGADFRDTDQMIEEEAGCTVSGIFESRGEQEFRNMETELLRRLVRKKEAGVLGRPAVYSVGGGLPLREENRELLRRLGRVIYLKISPEGVLSRLRGDVTRPLLQGDNVQEKVEALMTQREPVYAAAADSVICVDERKIEDITALIRGKADKK